MVGAAPSPIMATLSPEDVAALRGLVTRAEAIEKRMDEINTSAGALVERLGNAEQGLLRVTAALDRGDA